MFLATCLYLNADVKLDFVLKNIPCVGLIGIDKHLKHFKFLRLHAISKIQQDICKNKRKLDLGICLLSRSCDRYSVLFNF